MIALLPDGLGYHLKRSLAIVFLAAWMTGASPGIHAAFSYLDVGETLENREMPALDGKKYSLLGEEESVSVFLFFKPSQEHSSHFLEQIALLHEKMADEPVHWVAIASDRFPEKDLQDAVDKVSLKMPVLLDKGDQLYGELGVVLIPVVGIFDSQHVLSAYQPFQSINYSKIIEARVRYLLGEIDAEELERQLNPPRTVQGGEDAVIGRKLQLVSMLQKSGKHAMALQQLDKVMEEFPGSARVHLTRGDILRESGDCPAALASYALALELDPGNEQALAGKQACEGN